MAGKQEESVVPLRVLAKARLREMRAAAKAAARDLGLPPAAEPAVLAVLYRGDIGSNASPAIASPPSGAVPRTASAGEDANLRRRLHRLVDGFLRAHAPAKTEEFAGLWEALGSTPVAEIRRAFGGPQAAVTGLSFAAGDDELARIVAVSAWALTKHPGREAILDEAERQNLPRARRHALAAYLASHLDDL